MRRNNKKLILLRRRKNPNFSIDGRAGRGWHKVMVSNLTSVARVSTLAFIFSVSLSSCGGLPSISWPRSIVNPMKMFKKPAEEVAPTEEKPVAVTMRRRAHLSGTLASGDEVKINVYEGVRNTKRIAKIDQLVDEFGEIVAGRIGAIKVAGRTPREVEQLIVSAARRSEQPLGVKFTVHLESLNGNPVVEVRGKVVRSGMVALGPENLSIADVIAGAGGLKQGGEISEVTLLRKGKRVMLRADDPGSMKLKPGDRVEVGQ